MQIIEELSNRLRQFENIDFAMLFGSFGTSLYNDLSDIDIAVHFRLEYSLLDVGEIVVALERISERRVDVLPLNDLFVHNPRMAFEIVSTGRLLFATNQVRFVRFKKNTILSYLDAKPMLDMFRARFEERLRSQRFGELRQHVR